MKVKNLNYNTVENGTYVPSTVLALRIATMLNCTIEYLFQ